MTGPLEVEIHEDAHALVIRAIGLIDVYSARDLRRHLHAARDTPADGVVVDVTGAEFGDAAGVTALNGLYVHLSRRGRMLVIATTSERVRKAFDFAAGEPRVHVVDNGAQAMRLISPGGAAA